MGRILQRSGMTDDRSPLPDTPAPADTSAPRHSPPRSWLGLLLVVAVAAAGYGLWQYHQQLRATVAQQNQQLQQFDVGLRALETQAGRMEQRQTDLVAANRRAASEIAEFANRIEQHDQMVGRLDEQLSGGRARFQLAAVEQLLVLANDRLLLARDVQAVLIALDEADRRLGALNDPRLFPVRQALAQERTALRAVPQPDLTGAALNLSSLIARAPRLPLAANVPTHFDAPEPQPAAPEATDPGTTAASAWTRLRVAVRQALGSMFTVRRNAGPSPRLLSAEQETLIVQMLTLRLEGARLALLRNDAVSFRDLCESAGRWLDDYFATQDAGVMAAKAELQRLQPLDLAPPLPDISRSLVLLRTHQEPAPQ